MFYVRHVESHEVALTCSLTETFASLDFGLLGGLSTCRSGMRGRLDRALLAVTSLDMAFTPTIGGDRGGKKSTDVPMRMYAGVIYIHSCVCCSYICLQSRRG